MKQPPRDVPRPGFDSLVPSEMWRTTGKGGTSTGWTLVANVNEDEIQRLRAIADTLSGEASLLRHSGGVTFGISRIEARPKRYTFIVPLIGPEVLAMLRLMPITGFRVAFSSGTHDVFRYAFPVAPEKSGDFLASHLRRYTEEAVLAAASDVALQLLEDVGAQQPGGEHLVCAVATPGLKAWAGRQYKNE